MQATDSSGQARAGNCVHSPETSSIETIRTLPADSTASGAEQPTWGQQAVLLLVLLLLCCSRWPVVPIMIGAIVIMLALPRLEIVPMAKYAHSAALTWHTMAGAAAAQMRSRGSNVMTALTAWLRQALLGMFQASAAAVSFLASPTYQDQVDTILDFITALSLVHVCWVNITPLVVYLRSECISLATIAIETISTAVNSFGMRCLSQPLTALSWLNSRMLQSRLLLALQPEPISIVHILLGLSITINILVSCFVFLLILSVSVYPCMGNLRTFVCSLMQSTSLHRSCRFMSCASQLLHDAGTILLVYILWSSLAVVHNIRAEAGHGIDFAKAAPVLCTFCYRSSCAWQQLCVRTCIIQNI